MNTVGSTVLQSILLTILWVGFVCAAGGGFNDDEPPKAIIVPPESVELEPEGENKEPPESVVQQIIENKGGSLMTQEEFQKETEQYERNKWLWVGLTIVLGIAVLFIGTKLFEHWGYGIAALALGPVIVAYYFLYKTNLPSPPTPSL